MSFLAQLRQRSSTANDGARLCYLLHQDAGRLRLSLHLADVRGDRMESPGKAYLIEQTHLRAPPPFLKAGDIEVLSSLVGAAPQWQAQNSGELPGGWGFLSTLLATRHCFFGLPGQPPCRIHAGEPAPGELRWIVDADGRRRLAWKADGQVLTLGGSADLVVYRPAADSLAPLRHSVGDKGLEAAVPWLVPQPTEAVDAMREWTVPGLPVPQQLVVRKVAASLVPLLLCDRPAEAMHARLRLGFEYSNQDCCAVFAPGETADVFRYLGGDDDLLEFERDLRAEAQFADELAEHLAAFSTGPDGSWTADSTGWQKLLTDGRAALEPRGFRLRATPAFARDFAWSGTWQVSVTPQDAQAWALRMHVCVDGKSIDLLELLARIPADCLENGRIPLDDGRLLLLPLNQARSLAAEVSGMADHGGVARLPGSQLNRLANIAQTLPEDTRWLDDGDLLGQANRLLEPAQLLSQDQIGVEASLRSYQWQGVSWLQHLRVLGVNGLLADDMGLGKTLQAIAHLCLERNQGRLTRPALIVAPTSLLHNWYEELGRFAPSLRRCLVHGAGRGRLWKKLGKFDVLITSYTLLVHDLEHWQQQPLSWLVLDEAQWIKNPGTRSSQAVRQLAADHRLALSGTPVENHLGELWSIMDFLNPQCLGTERDFRNHFREPIEQRGDAACLRVLLRRVSPWMLRRTKDQVAAELPPKTVIQRKVPLGDEQREFYEQLKSSTWSELDVRLAEPANSGERHMLVLSALLRLRQACCDPALLGHAEVPSAKRQHCMEMVGELVEESHAVLLFSQFATMLDLLAEDLRQRGIPFFLLTGQTSADERKRQVAAFQAGEAPVFLISLKAGGVGLNLTRADAVIHFDPWWNDAAERQASDRAHRLGQDKPVFVYQLIAEDSVEERIAELQKRKAALGEYVNQQAQVSAQSFALKFEELIALCRPLANEG